MIKNIALVISATIVILACKTEPAGVSSLHAVSSEISNEQAMMLLIEKVSSTGKNSDVYGISDSHWYAHGGSSDVSRSAQDRVIKEIFRRTGAKEDIDRISDTPYFFNLASEHLRYAFPKINSSHFEKFKAIRGGAPKAVEGEEVNPVEAAEPSMVNTASSEPSTSSTSKSKIILFEGTKRVVIGAVQAHELSPSIKAFLDMIAAAEGTSNVNTPCGNANNGYGSLYRCFAQPERVFSNYSDHPRKEFYTPWGSLSDAAGRYQFLASTWNDVKRQLGLPDFSPASQDRGAANYLLKFRYAYNTVQKIGADQEWIFRQALDKVACEWASIPKARDSAYAKYGGCHDQPIHAPADLWHVYKEAYKIYAN